MSLYPYESDLVNVKQFEYSVPKLRIFGFGLVAGKALNKGLQFADLILPALLLVVHERLHHLAGFIPEIVVA